jgi:hypothetical protein
VSIQGTVATGGLVSGTCPNLRFVVVQQGTGKAFTVVAGASTTFVNGACAGIAGALQVQVTGILVSQGNISATIVQSQDHAGG